MVFLDKYYDCDCAWHIRRPLRITCEIKVGTTAVVVRTKKIKKILAVCATTAPRARVRPSE